MVKGKKLFFVLLVLLPAQLLALTPSNESKSYSSVSNYLAVSLTGGYSNLLTFDKITTPIGFLGGMVGIGYEMRVPKKHFWWSIMGEAECYTSVITLSKETGLAMIKADENYPAGKSYELTHWAEYPHYLFISVPILFGYMKGDFYFGAGPKVMFSPYGKNIDKLSYTISNEDGTEVHNYQKSASAGVRNSGLNIAGCFEIGGLVYDESFSSQKGKNKHVFNSYKQRLAIKLAFYAEYGFLNSNTSNYSGKVISVKNDGSGLLAVKPLFTTNSMTDRTINPFFLGLKVVLIYNSKEK